MSRSQRITVGNMVYHVLNRANGKEKIFHKDRDFEAFENILIEAKEKCPMRILAYCIMPNHWHLVLYPYKNGDLSTFTRWLTLTHVQRWHAHYQSVGYGHLYQGRFKSFPVQKDEYFLRVCRYVERNAQRAKLVKKAEDWRWGSAWRRTYGSNEQQKILSKWPVEFPLNYREWLNEPLQQEKDILDDLRTSVNRGRPYGETSWTSTIAKELGLNSTLRHRGRPNKST